MGRSIHRNTEFKNEETLEDPHVRKKKVHKERKSKIKQRDKH